MADADFHSKYTGEQIEEILDGAVLDNRYKQASAVQRARARTNIGATADEMQVVSFALSQELTKDQKAIARKNIGAGSSDIGLVIKGYVNTVDELQEIVGKDGEAYGVGSAYPYDIYIWDSYRDIWVNNGNIRGADGTDGKDGSDAEVTAENIETALGFKPLPVSNTNLFHNWWFGSGVVNQHGKTTYSAAVQYTIDRWKTTNANTSVIVNPDSITIENTTAGSAGYLLQVIEDYTDLLGKPVTMSAMLGDKSIIHSTADMPNVVPATSTTVLSLMDGDKSIGGLLFYPVSGKMQLWGRIWSASTENSRTFKAAKLERGRVSTLANDHAPDPAFELLKCQKYQFLIPFGDASAPVATGIAWTAENIRVFMPTPVNMRVANAPLDYLLGGLSNIRLKGAGQNLTPSAVSCSITNGGVIMAFTVSGAIANNVYSVVASRNEIKALINVNL